MSRYQDALARNELDETESLEQEPVEAEVSEGDDGGPANDPVRMYLKRLGDTPLLTREGEVAVGRKMAEGKRQVLLAVLSCHHSIVELLAIKDRLLSGKLRVRDVVSDSEIEQDDESDAETVESLLLQRLVAQLDGLGKRYADLQKKQRALRNASRPPSVKRKRELLLEVSRLRDQLVDDVAAMRFHPRLIDALSQKVKTMAQQAEQLRQSHQKIEDRAGMPASSIALLIADQGKKTEAQRRAQLRKLGLRAEELDELARQIKDIDAKMVQLERERRPALGRAHIMGCHQKTLQGGTSGFRLAARVFGETAAGLFQRHGSRTPWRLVRR